MSDKIEEIRERWAEFESLDHQSQVWDAHLYMRRAHNDRATLLAEVDRLRAEIERLHKEADLTREALGGWALVPPDEGADPTHERVAAVVAEVERMRAVVATLEIVGKAADDERAKMRAEVERLRGDAQAIAAIAHTGGTAKLSEHEALVEIRRRTLKAWDGKTSRAPLEAKP